LHIISTKKQSNYGILYVVATPIGNINDITYRAVEVLSNVYIIATEDTRHSKKIFNYFGIKTKQISYHKHNEVERRDYLIKLLLEGKDIAIVSDAGTPSISDPGDIIISEAHKKNIMVSPIPGVSSVIAAISSSGFASDDFKFIGFLPKKNSKKLDILKIKNNFSLVFFESPNRVINTLEELRKIYGGQKKILVAKEITKIYENINHLSLDDWFEYFSENNNERLKGEFVIIIPKEELTNKDVSDSKIESFIILLLKNNVSYNSTIKIVCNFYKLNKNKIYKEYINLAKK
tara:strand:+ start:513 stop:1382 length:870 start_codon:yes stop_codon:yes gene_type:complete